MAETPDVPHSPDADSDVRPAGEAAGPSPDAAAIPPAEPGPMAEVPAPADPALEVSAPEVPAPENPSPEAAESAPVLPVLEPMPSEFAVAMEAAGSSPAPEPSAASTAEPTPPGPETGPLEVSEPPPPEGIAFAAVSAEAAPAAPADAAMVAPAASESSPVGIAASLEVPALEAAAAGEGGEFDLLVGKVSHWLEQADLTNRWESLGGPLRGLALLVVAVVVLRLYSALLETLGDLPLIPRLLQLVGLIVVLRFALSRFVRSSDRQQILALWKERWNDFRGRA